MYSQSTLRGIQFTKPVFLTTLSAQLNKVIVRWKRKSSFVEIMNKTISVKPPRPSKAPAPKKRTDKPCDMNQQILLTVVKSGANDGPKSVFLTTSHRSFLFNCGEGTQRSLLEGKLRLAAVEDIFLTHNSWENIGGLFGLMMTLGSSSDSLIKVHGPPLVEQVLMMTKSFSDSPNAVANIEKREVHGGTYEDSVFDIQYVKIHKGNYENEKTEETASEEPEKKRKRWDEQIDFAVAYILRPKPLPRKVDVKKLMELNVKAGPWVKELVKGESVTLENGKVVHPDDISSPRAPLHPIVVLECPNKDFLKNLTSCEQLLKMAEAGAEVEELTPCVMVHMSPSAIVEETEYQEFISRFKNTDHILLNSGSRQSIMIKSVKHHQTYNKIHPRVFPRLQVFETHAEAPLETEGNIFQAECDLKYSCRPATGIDWKSCQNLGADEEPTKIDQIDKERQAKVINSWVERHKEQLEAEVKKPYPEVVFLGTGSAIPQKPRNVSSILVHLSPEKCMLLDTGEGTIEQLRTFYGDQVDNVLSKLAAVFISHVHADHHLGLFGVLNARLRAHKRLGLAAQRLPILAPVTFQRWLHLYFKIIQDLYAQITLVAHAADDRISPEIAAMRTGLEDKLDLKKLETVPVNHIKHSYGLCLTHKEGWKLVYSGDTMPCDRLVESGKGCDLLIHEATFSDVLHGEAFYKNHSTTGQAIEIGHRMEAKCTILNHFSQRYGKIPLITEDFTDDIGFSFDLMKVTLDDLPFLHQLRTVFEELYEDDINEQRQKEYNAKLHMEAVTDARVQYKMNMNNKAKVKQQST